MKTIITDKLCCPECGSTDWIPLFLYEETVECCNCGATFSKQLEECSCGSNSFELLINGFFRCTKCNRIYDEYGNEKHLFCQRCGSQLFNYLGQVSIYEQCFECEECKERYDSDYPELYYED